MNESVESPRIKVWDAPVRLFHWALAALVVTSVATGLSGGNAMLWHMRSGAAILALVVFRVLWGLAGSTTARFSDFVHGPAPALAYARDLAAGRQMHCAGHNPLGGWMVLMLLAGLLFQGGTGLFANDDIATEGPLYGLVSKATSDMLTGWHKLNVRLLYAMVALHLAAVVFHLRARGENLVRPMFTGYKTWPSGAPVPGLKFSSPWLALALFAACSLTVYFVVSTYPS